jgi:hypothetical protein
MEDKMDNVDANLWRCLEIRCKPLINIVTDFLKAFVGNGSVNTFQLTQQ